MSATGAHVGNRIEEPPVVRTRMQVLSAWKDSRADFSGASDLNRADDLSSHRTSGSAVAEPAPGAEDSVQPQDRFGPATERPELSAEESSDGQQAQQTSPDDELVRRAVAGDNDAFEALVRKHSSRVFSIVGSFFRRRDLVEDVAQEVFAKAYFSLATFTIGRSFEAWVAKIAVNACYDQLRAQRRRIEQQLPHESQQEDEWLELQMLEVARDRHASHERQRDAAELAERLMSRLDPDDRLVLVLIDRDGYSVKDVAELTGWGQSKVKVRAFRARRTLRAAMKRLVLAGERMRKSGQDRAKE
jgi:RNA polymerase sigma-70 factor (ECF subfamily)